MTSGGQYTASQTVLPPEAEKVLGHTITAQDYRIIIEGAGRAGHSWKRDVGIGLLVSGVGGLIGVLGPLVKGNSTGVNFWDAGFLVVHAVTTVGGFAGIILALAESRRTELSAFSVLDARIREALKCPSEKAPSLSPMAWKVSTLVLGIALLLAVGVGFGRGCASSAVPASDVKPSP